MGLRHAIRSAIDARRCLFLTYRNYSRVVEPYAFGVVSDGREVLCAYQLSGGDEAQVPTGWKTFDVRAIGGARMLEDGFSGERAPALPGFLALSAVTARVEADAALAAPHEGPERRAQPRHTG